MAKFPLFAAGACCLALALPGGHAADPAAQPWTSPTSRASRLDPSVTLLGPVRPPAGAVDPWVAQMNHDFKIEPDVVYRTVGGRALTVDLYLRSHPNGPTPVVYYIHGGAWAHGTKSWELGYMLPWLNLGWDVVSVEYRMTAEAHAPAAVEDCFWAYHWIGEHAAKYQFDLGRLIVSGASAGGNLALLVGMAPASAGFDRGAPGPLPRPEAIVSIAGVTDVVEGLSGPHKTAFTVNWIGGADLVDLARRVSPLTYVHPGLPPVFLVHGDADPTVPYEQALRLQAALTQAGVPNQLLTIPPGRHGGWRAEDYAKVYATLSEFLTRYNL